MIFATRALSEDLQIPSKGHGPATPCNFPPAYTGEVETPYVKIYPSFLESAPEIMHVQKKRRSFVKRVSFSPSVQVGCHQASSPEEVGASWLQREDMHRIKNEIKQDILAYRKVGRKALPSKYCVRGLENASSRPAAMMVRHMRKDAIHSVLCAQRGAVVTTGKCDPDLLCFVAEMKSREQVKHAIKMAAKDSRIWIEEFRKQFS